MSVIENLIKSAKQAPAHIVLPEGNDPRIVEGAIRAVREGIASITLIGNHEIVGDLVRKSGGNQTIIKIIDPVDSSLSQEFSDVFWELRKARLSSKEDAIDAVSNPLVFAALMVRLGCAEGTIGGAVATTADTVRAALQLIGKSENTSVVSSLFLMGLPKTSARGEETVVFADCALVADPNPEQLADIAIASADNFRAFMEDDPRVAMLSFSTLGSARHHAVSKVADATALVREKRPDIILDGEMQFDAAFVPDVASSKAPESSVAGKANVFVFPSLDAANIGYKIAQRIGGASAIGPILQGLAKPANDLSRGCSAEDVFNMIAVTVNQVGMTKSG